MWENQETDVMWNWPSQASQSSQTGGSTPNWWDRNRDWVMQGANALMGVAGAAYSNRQNRKAEDRAAALQKEFAQNGIRWRVADATAAGLHPLYALGGQLPSFSPAFSTDTMGPALAEAGQNISRAVMAGATPYERRLNELNLRLMESQIGETDARKELARSQAMRERLDAYSSVPIPMSDNSGSVGPLGETLTNEGVEIVGQHVNKAPNSFMPSEMDASVGANINPLWSRFRIGKNQEIVLPGGISGDAAEALESLAESPVLMWMTYQENVARYGEPFKDFLVQRYGSKWLADPWESFVEWARSKGAR